MNSRRASTATAGVAAVLMIVAGCSSGSDGNVTPSATATVTTTHTVSSPALPTGSGVPATSTAPAATTTTGGSASGPGLCTPTVMTFAVSANSGAGGSTYFQIHATNGSRTACVTTGFPGIAFLDAAGKQILQADRDDPSTVTTIVVQPGQEISAQVRAEGSDVENGGTPCPSSPRFLLTLPDNRDSTTITHSTPACQVSVAAFVRGANG